MGVTASEIVVRCTLRQNEATLVAKSIAAMTTTRLQGRQVITLQNGRVVRLQGRQEIVPPYVYWVEISLPSDEEEEGQVSQSS